MGRSIVGRSTQSFVSTKISAGAVLSDAVLSDTVLSDAILSDALLPDTNNFQTQSLGLMQFFLVDVKFSVEAKFWVDEKKNA